VTPEPAGPLVDFAINGEVGHGGIGRYTECLFAALREARVDVQYASFRNLPGARQHSLLTTIPIGLSGRRTGSIVHIPQIVGASLLFRRGIGPSVVTVHDIGVLDSPEDRLLTGPVSQRLIELSVRGLRRADHLIAVSEFTRQGLLRHGFTPDKVTTIYEGVDHDRFRPIADAASRLSPRYGLDFSELPTVLYVGNEFPRKNLKTLVRAIGQLKRAGTPVRWIKVGRAGHANARHALLREIDAENVRDLVTFVEDVSDADLPLFYAAANVYVQPSVYEGFGLPVLEAMACSTPVVASNAGALVEISGGAAAVVDPREPDEFANAITTFVADADCALRHTTLGIARTAQLAWSETARQTADIYRKTCGEAPIV
jgi:glycosyltransferase involved in cell wall biosynthesis